MHPLYETIALKYILLLALVFILSASCKEDDCNPLMNFSGITERDDRGKLLTADTKDWTLKDKWSDHEKHLFSSTHKTNCFPPSHFSIMAYPNPTEGTFQVNFSKSEATKVEIRLVDFDCRTLISVDDIESNSIGLEPGNFEGTGIVRLYYKFIEDGCEYQGHGDIQIQ